MLKKLTQLEVPPGTPFANDALERRAAIEKLTNLVESTEQPFVLSIEAPWGWGKTTFIRMWKAHLESKGHICLHFNAWETDFVDDPLVAFLGEMQRLVEQEEKDLRATEPIKAHWGEVRRIGAGVLRKALPLAVHVATQGLLSQDTIKQAAGAFSHGADDLAKFAETLAKERLEKYEVERNGIREFHSHLEKFAEEVLAKADRVSPLVFFIDELDRCRPDFAVALLERVKHLFDVHRVVFVLAVDRGQLNQSVKALYGLEAEPDGYLRRFIDLTYSLPPPTTEKFVETLYQRFGMAECFRERQGEMAAVWRTGFAHYAQALRLSLRAQEQCFTEMNIVWRTVGPSIQIKPALLAFFSALRAFRPGVVAELREGRIQVDTIIARLASVPDPLYRLWVEAGLIHGFLDKAERVARLPVLKERIKKEGVGTNDPRRAAALAEYFTEQLSSDSVSFVLSQLEMTTDFR